MAEVSTEMFIDAVKQVVKANEAFVPPYGKGATLYLRPLLLGIGDVIGVKPAEEYIFTVFAMPVGSYFKDGLTPSKFVISRDYDRAAPLGTGEPKLVETMLLLCKRKLLLNLQVMQMRFILIQVHILKLKKLVLQISSELHLKMSLLHH